MRRRRNPFECIARSLAHSPTEIVQDAGWFAGPNVVLLERGVFVDAPPRTTISCTSCNDGIATVYGRFAVCDECGALVSTEGMDMRRYKFSHEGMAALVQSELRLTHRQRKDGYDYFRAPNGRSVYYVRDAGVDRSRLMGERDPYVLYGSSGFAPRSKDDPHDMEMACIDTIFDVEEPGVIRTCRRALDLTDAHKRSAAVVSDKNPTLEVRRGLLAKVLLEAVRRLAHGRDLGRRSARSCYDRFGERVARMNPKCKATYKTIESDVAALCADRDFEACWDAFVSGSSADAGKALRALDKPADAAGGSAPDPDSLMRSLAKQRAIRGHADEEVDYKSALPYTDEESFWAEIDRRCGGPA